MKKLSLVIATSVLALTGCANQPMGMGGMGGFGGMQQQQQYPQQGYQQGYQQQNPNLHLGKILNVREYGMQKSDSNGLAIAGGAVAGGLLGNQVGGGRGKKLATIAGVAAGAYAGNELSKGTQVVPMVELQIREDNGQTYTINQEKNANYYNGQRVRVTIKGNVGTVTPY